MLKPMGSNVKNLCFIANRAQWKAAEARPPLEGPLVPASADLGWTLQQRLAGAPVVDLVGYMTPAVARELLELAWALCAELAEAWKGRAVFHGCDIVERMQNDMFYLFLTALRCEHMVRCALREHRPERVVHFKEMAEAFLWDPPEPPPDMFNAAVAWCAEREGIPATAVDGPRPAPPAAAAPDPGPAAPAKPLPGVRPIALLVSAHFRSEMMPLVRRVIKDERNEWVVLSDAAGPIKGVVRMDASLLDGLPLVAAPFRDTVEMLRDEGLPVLTGGGKRDLAVINENPRLRFAWDRWTRRLLAGARRYARAELLCKALQPRALVTGYDFEGGVRCFQQAFLDAGVPVISIDHVGLSLPSSQRRNRGARAHVAVWGEHDARGQERFRGPNRRAFRVGCMRSELAETLERSQPGASRPARTMPSSRVVFFTSKRAQMWGTSVDTSRYLETWLGLARLGARRREWDFIIKPHPRYDNDRFYERLIAHVPGGMRLLACRAREALADAGVAVLMNTPSTVGIEAVAMGVPLVYLRDSLLDGARGHSPLEDGGAVVVRSVSDLEAELERLSCDAPYRASVCERARTWLSSVLQATGEAAVRNMLEATETIAGDMKRKPVRATWERAALEMVRFGEVSRPGSTKGSKARTYLERLLARTQEDNAETSRCAEWLRAGPARVLDAIANAEEGGTILARLSRLWRTYRAVVRPLRPPFGIFRQCVGNALAFEAREGNHGACMRGVCGLLRYAATPKLILPRRNESEVGATDKEETP
jgi:hypothetical protein